MIFTNGFKSKTIKDQKQLQGLLFLIFKITTLRSETNWNKFSVAETFLFPGQDCKCKTCGNPALGEYFGWYEYFSMSIMSESIYFVHIVYWIFCIIIQKRISGNADYRSVELKFFDGAYPFMYFYISYLGKEL